MKRLEFRYLVCAPNLNAHGTLHGGELLRWIDESAGMHARQLTRRVCVTRFIDQIDFISTARAGDIIYIVTTIEHAGSTSSRFVLRRRKRYLVEKLPRLVASFLWQLTIKVNLYLTV